MSAFNGMNLSLSVDIHQSFVFPAMFVSLQNKQSQTQMVGSLKGISVASSKLLLAVKSMAADPNGPNTKNALSAAAR